MGGAADRRAHLRPLIALALAVAVLAAVRACVIEPFAVESSSMAPTVRDGEHVLVDKRSGAVGPGELVVFRAPGSGAVLLKRVVAVAGQDVGIEDGVLRVDGRAPPEPYVDAGTVDSVYFGPVRVPRGAVFVLGDQRADSVDSRAFGPVSTSSIIGRAVARLWPPGSL